MGWADSFTRSRCVNSLTSIYQFISDICHTEATPVLSVPTPMVQTTTTRSKQKNWEALAKEALEKEGKDKTTSDDPNAGGDAALNGFFQQIYAGADEDSKRAMLKSYTESGGTTLSTNWADVKKAPVEVKPPAGSEYKKYGV